MNSYFSPPHIYFIYPRGFQVVQLADFFLLCWLIWNWQVKNDQILAISYALTSHLSVNHQGWNTNQSERPHCMSFSQDTSTIWWQEAELQVYICLYDYWPKYIIRFLKGSTLQRAF